MENYPLISVLLITYNNAGLIYDALDSIFMQDYRNIELIISDDASTMPFPASEIMEYVEQHRGENIRQVILNQNSENLGTVRHLEVIREKSHGEIELVIAADDAWADAGVFSAFAGVFQRFPEAECVTSQLGMYDRHLQEKNRDFLSPEVVSKLKAGDMEWLRNECACRCILPSIGTAYRRSIFAKIGCLGDLYSVIEDYPMHVRITRMRIPVYYLDRLTAKHREGGISNDHTRNGFAFSLKFQQDYLHIYENEILAHREEYPAETILRAQECYRKRQEMLRALQQRKAQKDEEARILRAQQMAAATQPQSTAATAGNSKGDSSRLKAAAKSSLQRLCSWRQMQFLLIAGALLLLAAAAFALSARAFPWPVLFWLGAVCLFGALAQLCLYLLLKLRQGVLALRQRN